MLRILQSEMKGYKDIKFKKRVRLKEFEYKGRYRYFLTICCNSNGFFRDKAGVDLVLDILRKCSLSHLFTVWAYCFMPDHLHLLIEGQTDSVDMKNFVSVFKQKSGHCYQRQFRKRPWQINYYEHILRKEEVTEKVMNYIFNNPVRKGIVDTWDKYPFSGSFALDLKQP